MTDTIKLPEARETERALLGAILIDPTIVFRLNGKLTADDFYMVSHKWIFEAIQELATRDLAVDAVTVAEHLRKHDRLGKLCGGDELAAQFFISDLITSDTTYGLNYQQYVDDIKEASKRRKLISTASQIAKYAHDESVPVEIAMHTIETAVLDMRGDESKSHLFYPEQYTDDFMQWLESEEALGLPTGFYDLDRAIGGLEKGNMYVIGGAEKMGKSTMLLDISRHIALRPDNPVVVRFSLEMTTTLLMRRDLAAITRFPVDKFKKRDFTDSEWPVVWQSINTMRNTNLIQDTTRGITPNQIRAKLNQIAMRYGRVDLVVIDYFQIMGCDGSYANENEKHIRVSNELAKIAGDFDCPVLLGAQVLSKSIDHRQDKRPMLSDVRGSSALQSDAYFVAFVYRDAYYNPDLANPAEGELIIRAHREGPPRTIPLYYNGECATFGNAAKVQL